MEAESRSEKSIDVVDSQPAQTIGEVARADIAAVSVLALVWCGAVYHRCWTTQDRVMAAWRQPQSQRTPRTEVVCRGYHVDEQRVAHEVSTARSMDDARDPERLAKSYRRDDPNDENRDVTSDDHAHDRRMDGELDFGRARERRPELAADLRPTEGEGVRRRRSHRSGRTARASAAESSRKAQDSEQPQLRPAGIAPARSAPPTRAANDTADVRDAPRARGETQLSMC